jgi:hypothetical protein
MQCARGDADFWGCTTLPTNARTSYCEAVSPGAGHATGRYRLQPAWVWMAAWACESHDRVCSYPTRDTPRWQDRKLEPRCSTPRDSGLRILTLRLTPAHNTGSRRTLSGDPTVCPLWTIAPALGLVGPTCARQGTTDTSFVGLRLWLSVSAAAWDRACAEFAAVVLSMRSESVRANQWPWRRDVPDEVDLPRWLRSRGWPPVPLLAWPDAYGGTTEIPLVARNLLMRARMCRERW